MTVRPSSTMKNLANESETQNFKPVEQRDFSMSRPASRSTWGEANNSTPGGLKFSGKWSSRGGQVCGHSQLSRTAAGQLSKVMDSCEVAVMGQHHDDASDCGLFLEEDSLSNGERRFRAESSSSCLSVRSYSSDSAISTGGSSLASSAVGISSQKSISQAKERYFACFSSDSPTGADGQAVSSVTNSLTNSSSRLAKNAFIGDYLQNCCGSAAAGSGDDLNVSFTSTVTDELVTLLTPTICSRDTSKSGTSDGTPVALRPPFNQATPNANNANGTSARQTLLDSYRRGQPQDKKLVRPTRSLQGQFNFAAIAEAAQQEQQSISSPQGKCAQHWSSRKFMSSRSFGLAKDLTLEIPTPQPSVSPTPSNIEIGGISPMIENQPLSADQLKDTLHLSQCRSSAPLVSCSPSPELPSMVTAISKTYSPPPQLDGPDPVKTQSNISPLRVDHGPLFKVPSKSNITPVVSLSSVRLSSESTSSRTSSDSRRSSLKRSLELLPSEESVSVADWLASAYQPTTNSSPANSPSAKVIKLRSTKNAELNGTPPSNNGQMKKPTSKAMDLGTPTGRPTAGRCRYILHRNKTFAGRDLKTLGKSPSEENRQVVGGKSDVDTVQGCRQLKDVTEKLANAVVSDNQTSPVVRGGLGRQRSLRCGGRTLERSVSEQTGYPAADQFSYEADDYARHAVFDYLPLLPLLDSDDKDRGINSSKWLSIDTVADLIRGKFHDTMPHFLIIDCRWPYEYAGGHLRGAQNYWSYIDVREKLFDPPIHSTLSPGKSCQSQSLDGEKHEDSRSVALIFHCEMSSKRGPDMAYFVQNIDLRINLQRCSRGRETVPTFYPQIYVMADGYRAFHGRYPELCEPHHYVREQENLAESQRYFARVRQEKKFLDGRKRRAPPRRPADGGTPS